MAIHVITTWFQLDFRKRTQISDEFDFISEEKMCKLTNLNITYHCL